MPRDTAGNYNLPAGNPVASGEIISASWANSTMGDLGQTLSASLDRYGRGGMLAPFQFTDGTEAAPGATWSNEPTTGFYRAAYGDVRMSVVGQDSQRWTDTSSYLWRNGQWEEILTSGGGGGGTTINDLVVTGSFTSPGIDDNATSTAITIDASQNVGIGTDSPVGLLHLESSSPALYMTNTTNGTDGVISVDSAGSLVFNADLNNERPSSNVRFAVDGSEAMRVDSGGRLLVGTSSYGYGGVDLTVGDTADTQNGVAIQSSPTGYGYLMFGDGGGADSYRGQLLYKHDDDFMAMHTAGSEKMRIDASGNLDLYQGQNLTWRYLAGSTIRGSLSVDSSDNITFSNGSDNTERMRIDSTGNVKIGTKYTSTTASLGLYRALANDDWDALTLSNGGGWSSATDKAALVNVTDGSGTIGKFGVTYGSDAKGAFVVRNLYNGTYGASGTVLYVRGNGNVTATGNVTAYSDERLKDDIQTLDGSKVYDMRGVSFTKDGEAGSGVIAQELQMVAPELVHEGEEYLSVAYGNLVGYLIEAVKDLKAEVEELKRAK